MISIFPLLLPSLQTKLAQYALLTQRAAVLAAMPVVPNGKGRPLQWATQPPPELLRNVVHFAGKAAAPKVGRLLLRTWFQKKTELRAAVYNALDEAGYPMALLAEYTEPRQYNMILGPEDISTQAGRTYFYPAGKPVPDIADASDEEATLMAFLLGWTVLPIDESEIPPEALGLHTSAQGKMVFQTMGELLLRLPPNLPPELAAAAERGEMPDEMAPYWFDDNWAAVRKSVSDMRAILQDALQLPVSAPEALLTLAECSELIYEIEYRSIGAYLNRHHRIQSMVRLALVDRLRHRQQPDFAPLLALHERTAALRAGFEADWPLTGDTAPLTIARQRELLSQVDGYRLLLRLVQRPEELATLDETSQDYQVLEAVTPPGVLNALLLRKLYLPA